MFIKKFQTFDKYKENINYWKTFSSNESLGINTNLYIISIYLQILNK